jgi:hypothetical protein
MKVFEILVDEERISMEASASKEVSTGRRDLISNMSVKLKSKNAVPISSRYAIGG